MRLILTPYDVALLTPPVEEEASGFNAADYFRAVSTVRTATSATITANRPTGTTDGDLLVVTMATANVTISAVPSGWTLAEERISTSAFYIRVYYKVASSEPATWDWTASGSAAYQTVCVAYKDAATATEDVSGSAAIASVSSIDAPSVTTTVANTLLVVAIEANGFVTFSQATMTERADSQAASPSFAMYDEVVASAGATGVRTVDIATTKNPSVVIVAFRK